MAKKTTKPATKAKKKAPAKKPAKKVERVEIEIDPVETKAFELAHGSAAVCRELEVAVTSALTQSVRKVFKQHRIALSTTQAEKVALLLFGD